MFDSEGQTLTLYCEDAGLDLINKVVGAVTLKDKTLIQMLQAFVPSDWSINIIGAPTNTKTYTWDGENTATERINSIAESFGYEVYYSVTVEGMTVMGKNLNILKKRGRTKAEEQLRLGREIKNIVTSISIRDLATAFAVTGGTPEGKKAPINLKEYAYSYADPKTGDIYEVHKPTGQMRNITAMRRWSSVLDSDGLIVKRFQYESTNKATLAGQARAELQKVSQLVTEYEVEIIQMPDGTQVGDRINIIDEDGELYLDARILKIETSESSQTKTATIGEYVKRGSGINPELVALAKQFAESVKDGLDGVTISISSSGGNTFHNRVIETTLQATIFFGEKAITTQAELEAVFGIDAEINWYSGSNIVGSGFELNVSSQETQVQYKVRLIA